MNNPCVVSSLSSHSNQSWSRLGRWRCVAALSAVVLAILPGHAAQSASFKSEFQKVKNLPQGWSTQGDVAITSSQPFQPGAQSLLLARTLEKSESPVEATSPTFTISPGLWDVSVACKADLNSHDNSFRGLITLDFLDATGKTVDQVTVVDIFGVRPWQSVIKRVETPKGATSARFHVELQKTWGEFRVDGFSAVFVAKAPNKDRRIDRMYFASPDPNQGHFLYPEEPKSFAVTVESTEPLPPEQLTVSCLVTDYWGAEQNAPIKVALKQAPEKKNNRFVYSGTLDLSKVPLELGRYYELHGEIQRANNDAYRNFSSFVIEPEAVANNYKASEIPFTGRNWDSRIPEGFTLAHRLGIRIMGIRNSVSPTPPYALDAPCIDLVQKYHMGAVFGVPSSSIENHSDDWQKYDEKALRGVVHSIIQNYRKTADPFILSLGNEPPVMADRIAADVNAYRIIYDEAKKTDPSVIVLGTSIGIVGEPFFKEGFGKWCDAYDFHVYEAPENVTMTLQGYPEYFKKYGNPKPIWSTEIGINSQGMSRHAVAVDMVKKFTVFFANGGVNMSWFDLFYPDPDVKIYGDSTEAHNVFDSRYVQYAPKLTAVTYYNLVNTIAIKKFVQEKKYGDDIDAFLFRDRDNRQLQVLWKSKGRMDAFLPLPGVQNVEVIRIDGSHRELNAGGKGVSLTISDDPLLLLYDGTAPLAEKLDIPPATVSVPTELISGAPNVVTVNLSGASADQINLLAPPFWKVTKETTGQSVKFTLAGPATSAISEADLIVTLGDGKSKNTGEFYLRPSVAGQLTAQILPVPTLDGKAAAVKLVVKNNVTTSQKFTWSLSLANQLSLINGEYTPPAPVTSTHFAKASSGQATIAGGATQEIVVPLAGVDSQAAYGIHATVTDATGRTQIRDRNVAGFVPVPKAKGQVKLDGTFDSPDWKRAPVQKIDESRQYFSFDPTNVVWKGPQDLSGTVRFLWDDRYLYVGVEVTDDIAGALQEDDRLWMQDGLQFLIDPCRAMTESTGKYDYCCAIGKKGPQTWCNLSADGRAPSGNVKDAIVSFKRKDAKSGSITYVIAFPWVRVAPFQPAIGGDLGLTLILNEDDGTGRKSYMTWFGNANSKQVDSVGDLILTQ